MTGVVVAFGVCVPLAEAVGEEDGEALGVGVEVGDDVGLIWVLVSSSLISCWFW